MRLVDSYFLRYCARVQKPTTPEQLYIDIDGFFAACEEQADRQLQGRPLGVIPFAGAVHSCVIASNTLAKRAGVTTGMAIADARRRCPGIALVPQQPDLLYPRAPSHRRGGSRRAPHRCRAEQEAVLSLLNEAAGGQVVDQGPVHLFVEIEIKRVEGAVAIAKAGLLDPARDASVLPPDEFVPDERGDEIDGGLLLGLGLAQADLEGGRHAREPELAEGGVEFNEIHAGSPVC